MLNTKKKTRGKVRWSEGKVACVAGLGSSGRKEKRKRKKETRVSPSRAFVLSCAHYFQAPATRAKGEGGTNPISQPIIFYQIPVLSLVSRKNRTLVAAGHVAPTQQIRGSKLTPRKIYVAVNFSFRVIFIFSFV